MESLEHEIRALNKSARKIHGPDIMIVAPRAIAFGDNDNLLIVLGKNHHLAAADIARSIGRHATITTEETPDFMGSGKATTSHITF